MLGLAKLRGFVRLFRWELPFTAAVCAIFGQFIALQRVPPLPQMGIGFLSVFLLSAAALILNDYFDLASDTINAPERPLPSGVVTPNEVLGLFGIVAALGLLCSALLGAIALIVGLAMWALGLLYNWRYKKAGLVGNLLLSYGEYFILATANRGRSETRLLAVITHIELQKRLAIGLLPANRKPFLTPKCATKQHPSALCLKRRML